MPSMALWVFANWTAATADRVAELKEVTDRINTGDLTASADIDRHDEIGQLAEAINRLQKTLEGGSKMKAAA